VAAAAQETDWDAHDTFYIGLGIERRDSMHKPKYHFFLCNSFRANGEPKGACNKKGSADLLQYLQTEIGDRGIDAIVSTTSCLNVCEQGPILVVYPNELWYFEITEQKLDEILVALEDGNPVPSLMTA
jgi:(2Fe-2S) ferredoxin